MPHQRSCDPADVLEPDVIAGAVLGCLIHDAPPLVTVEELTSRMAGFEGDRRKARRSVEDALSDLVQHGLAHRLDRFVFASQAAIRGRALTG